MADWFSAQITRNETEWARAFERTRSTADGHMLIHSQLQVTTR